MNTSLWIALVCITLGTYFIRVLPYLWMKQKLAKSQNNGAISNMPTWLTVLGPTMIAAMFGTSLVPAHPDTLSWVATAVGTLTTFLVWTRTRSMGWPILIGVMVFGVITLWF
ncbi:AzlD domain-containing protein [Marinomonas pontica]